MGIFSTELFLNKAYAYGSSNLKELNTRAKLDDEQERKLYNARGYFGGVGHHIEPQSKFFNKHHETINTYFSSMFN